MFYDFVVLGTSDDIMSSAFYQKQALQAMHSPHISASEPEALGGLDLSTARPLPRPAALSEVEGCVKIQVPISH